MRALVLCAVLATSAGCLRGTEFKCAVNDDCSATDAVCEPTGYCSFSDTECAGGRRYGELSGPLANQCVESTTDAGVDAPTTGACPASYTALPNAGTHVYRVAASADWVTQRNGCEQDGGYLAIPDTIEELQAITTASAATDTWIGIHDRITEGMYITVKGDPATFLPWAAGEPNNGGNQDCVSAQMASPTIATNPCSLSFPAVCECEP